MATRTTESVIPRTYLGSARLAGSGADAIARAATGFAYSIGHTVVTVAGYSIRSARASCAEAKARRAELKAAGQATVNTATRSNKTILIGAAAGLAMAGHPGSPQMHKMR